MTTTFFTGGETLTMEVSTLKRSRRQSIHCTSFHKDHQKMNTMKKSISMESLESIKDTAKKALTSNTESSMKKSLSCDAFGSVKDKLLNVKKSISLDDIQQVHEQVHEQHDIIDKMKEATSNIVKINGPGIAYDIAKDAIENIDSTNDFIGNIQTLQNDIEHIVFNHITQDSIVNTMTHIISHHHI